MFSVKTSTHIKAALSAALVIGLGVFLKQPTAAGFIASHSYITDILTAVGAGYGVYTQYSQPLDIPPATDPLNPTK